MFSITPIGSCRINTPLRLAEPSYRFARNLERVYGFTHTSAEAVQQVKFLRGEYTPSATVAPLISPSKPIAEVAQSRHALSDLYIIELSSAKQFKLGTECVQLNYLTRHFNSLFADNAAGAEFWTVASRNDQQDIDSFLHPFVQAGSITEGAFEVIRQLRCTSVTRAELDRDVRYLLEALPNAFFVTHVNAAKSDGLPISSRSNFIKLVRDVVKEAGGRVYDPTDLMLKTGQEFAIEDNSSSLAHFTPEFSRMLFDDWYQLHIKKIFDDMTDAPENPRNLGLVLNDLQARYDLGAIAELGPRINAAIAAFGPVSPLIGLQAQYFSALAEPEKARSALESSLAKSPEDRDLITLLIEWCLANQAATEGLRYFKQLSRLGEDLSVAKVIKLAALLEKSGAVAEAHNLVGDVIQNAPENDQALELYARLSLERNDQSGIRLCKNHILDRPRDIDTVLALELLLASREKDTVVHRYLVESLTRSIAPFSPTVTYLAENRKDDLIADVVGTLSRNNRDILRHPLIKDLVSNWGRELGADISTRQKFRILNRIRKLGGLSNELQFASRQLRTGLVSKVREAVVQDNFEAVLTLHNDATIALPPIPDSGIYLARQSYSNGAYTKALEFARGVVEIRADHTGSWVIIMRSALKLENYLLAEQAAAHLVSISGGGKAHIVEEARKRLSRLPSLCLVASRNTTDVFEAWQLCMISARDAALAERADRQFDKLKREMGATLRELHAARSPAYSAYVHKVLDLLPDFDLALQSLGRFYVSQRRFDKAMPYWERLVALDPGNGQANFQLDRCRERLSILRSA